MDGPKLLTVLSLVCVICLTLERKVAWLAHVSGVCLIIISALFLASTGLIPNQHPLYDFFIGPTIPIALALMVLTLDLRELGRLPRKLFLVYGVGVLGTTLGAWVAVLFAAPTLKNDAVLLAAQFSASYIGGGENAVAMQKILSIPNELFVAGFAVDNLLTSLWMMLTLVFAGTQLEPSGPSDLPTGQMSRSEDELSFNLVDVLFCLTAALVANEASHWLTHILGGLHPILYLTILTVTFGQIPFVKERTKPAYLMGCLLFAAFFFSIGAISDLRQLASLSWKLAAMPLIVVAVHGAVIYSAGHYFGVPRLQTSLASQSLVGGPATAVALAQARNWKAGVGLGLITGILGYAIANFFGYMVFLFARPLASWVGG